jgi:HlyD family secretion protein
VAASFSAPQLFLIANDLRKMQILATVDESDIGRIRDDQGVRFRVSAYPDRTFDGTVRQVRLQSTLVENVVNYTVVVDVDNKDRLLLPGMTATVDFFIEKATDVLKVQNSALRFRPTPEMMMELAELREGGRRPGGPPTEARGRGEGGARLFVLGADGSLSVIPVTTGISDGQWTEISGEGVSEGMEAIAGVVTEETPATSSPFAGPQPQPGPGRFGPRGF